MNWLGRLYRWFFPLPAPPAQNPVDEGCGQEGLVVDPQVPARPAPRIEAEPKKRKEYVVLAPTRRKIADSVNAVLDRINEISQRQHDDRLGLEDSRRALAKLLYGDFVFLEEGVDAEQDWTVLDPDSFTQAELLEAVWPLDVAYVVPFEETNNLAFFRTYTVDPKELRGKVKLVPQRMVNHVIGHFGAKGTWWAEQVPMGMIGGKWTQLDLGMTSERYTAVTGSNVVLNWRERKKGRGLEKELRMACSIALTRRYWWHAALGNENTRILVPTTPSGCLQLFKDRQKGSAESRRKALRHWVENHYRETTEGLQYVRDHLRGHTLFNWHDLSGEILVSEHDLERNEFFKNQANEWRARRQHNTAVRIRLKK